MLKAFLLAATLFGVVCQITGARGEEFILPDDTRDGVIGELRYTKVSRGDSLLDIGRAFDFGHDQIIAANPTLNRWVPPIGAEVVLPSLYVLPATERRGIVLNLSELRLYYYEPSKRVVHTFPVSIGDVDWKTPIGTTRITGKESDPAWNPPKSIREEHAMEGEELPTMIPGGDIDNPLGHYALRLGIPGYLIHGTDQRRSFGIGMRVSHGCIRLYPEDIETLYYLVPIGTQVSIINAPVKAGWQGDELYLEVHHPLAESDEGDTPRATISEVVNVLGQHLSEDDEISIGQIERAQRLGDGIPLAVAKKTKSP